MNAKQRLEELEELLHTELDDYSYFEISNVELDEETEDASFYDVTITNERNQVKHLRFKVEEWLDLDREQEMFQVHVCIYEDIYEEVTTYDWRVKHFWMTLLSWE